MIEPFNRNQLVAPQVPQFAQVAAGILANEAGRATRQFTQRLVHSAGRALSRQAQQLYDQGREYFHKKPLPRNSYYETERRAGRYWRPYSPEIKVYRKAPMVYRRKGRRSTRRRVRVRSRYRRGIDRRSVGYYRMTAGKCVEYKFHDVQRSNYEIQTFAGLGNDPVVDSFNLVPRGSAGFQRDGRKILIHSIELWLTFHRRPISGTAPLTTHYLRCALVLDTQCNGSAVTPNVVYSSPLGFINLEWRERFRIIKHWTYLPPVYDSNIVPATNPVQYRNTGVSKTLHFYKPLRVPVIFSNEDNPVIDNVSSHNLFFIAWSDVADNFTMYVNSRIRFTD